MAELINLAEYKRQTRGEKQPRVITFYGTPYKTEVGESKVTNISVHVENGDVVGILEQVIEEGGIGQTLEDGSYAFIPYPCAAIEIRNA
jgi:hypothetical protein